MEAFNAGTLAGAGSFRCDSCGFAVALARARPRARMPRVRGRELQARVAVRRRRSGRRCTTRSRERPTGWTRPARRSSARATTWRSRTTSGCACSRCRTGWTRIGRSLSAHVRFDDPTVSRRHALLYRDEAGARILDDRSLNGVFRTASASSWRSWRTATRSRSAASASSSSAWWRSRPHLPQALFTRRDGPVAELALGARDVDRALLRGDPDREAGERRACPERFSRRQSRSARARRRARHAGRAPTCRGSRRPACRACAVRNSRNTTGSPSVTN